GHSEDRVVSRMLEGEPAGRGQRVLVQGGGQVGVALSGCGDLGCEQEHSVEWHRVRILTTELWAQCVGHSGADRDGLTTLTPLTHSACDAAGCPREGNVVVDGL